MRFAIKQNTPLTSCVYRMVLQGDTSAITAPGQFVQVQVPGFYLRRPISRLIINEELGKGKSLEVGLDEQNELTWNIHQ